MKAWTAEEERASFSVLEEARRSREQEEARRTREESGKSDGSSTPKPGGGSPAKKAAAFGSPASPDRFYPASSGRPTRATPQPLPHPNPCHPNPCPTPTSIPIHTHTQTQTHRIPPTLHPPSHGTPSLPSSPGNDELLRQSSKKQSCCIIS